MDEAVKAREAGNSPTILFNLWGHGHFDMQAYTDSFAGKLVDQDLIPKRSSSRSRTCRRWRRSSHLQSPLVEGAAERI